MLIFIVLCLGVFQVYSASIMWAKFKYSDELFFLKRQFLFALMGCVVFYLASMIDLKKVQKYHKAFLLMTMILMVLVLIPGIGVERNGSRSWFKLAGFYLQPSELLKITMIFSSASYLSKKRNLNSFIKDLSPLLCLVLLGFGLVMLQPDFGSGIVMLCSIVAMVYVAGCPISYFIKGGIAGVLGMAALILSAPYRMERITSFIDPWKDPLGSGFQMIQSLYAISPGGLFGRGILASIQKQFYLPEPQTDFIFSIFAEEFGFFGCVILLTLYFMILWFGVLIAQNAMTRFEGYVAFGIMALFGIQVAINLGVVVGLFPVTGITLPLFSYGGSSLVVVMGMLGIVMGISKKTK